MKSLKDNPLFGIMAIVLSLAAYPFTTGFLFFRAMMRRVIMKVHQPKEEIFADGENVNDEGFSDYEEVETPELPEVKIKKAKGKDNDHDQMFD